MRYRQLGRSGLRVSVLGLGCNNFGLALDADQSRAVVDAALDCGVTLFDTAEAYGKPSGSSEDFLGQALVGRRQQAVVSTKVGSFSLRTPGLAAGSRRSIRLALEGSLRRLRTDYVDLLYLHQPDDDTPIEETLAAMDELVRAGMVRYLASANFSAWRLVEAELLARAAGSSRFIGSQNAYSLIDRAVELDIAPVCVKYDIGLAPYFPLAHGLLAGAHQRDAPVRAGTRLALRPQVLDDQTALDHVDALRAFADARELSLLQVALGGLAAKPAVASVIAGVSRSEQVHANAAASDWVPALDELPELDAIAVPLKYVPLGSRTGHRR